MVNRGVAQLVARYVRDVEAGSSSLLTPTKQIKALPLKREGFFHYGVAGSTCKSLLMKKALTQAKPGKGFYCFMVTLMEVRRQCAARRQSSHIAGLSCFWPPLWKSAAYPISDHKHKTNVSYHIYLLILLYD